VSYVPIALVISSEIENHDIFRETLIALFESIRDPEQVVAGDKIQNKRIAFADFLSHVALLKTIPCPTFNSKFLIEFLGKTLIINE
jgi:hypothetical protein